MTLKLYYTYLSPNIFKKPVEFDGNARQTVDLAFLGHCWLAQCTWTPFILQVPSHSHTDNTRSPIPYQVKEKFLGLGYKAFYDVLWLPDQLLPSTWILFETHLETLFIQKHYSVKYFLPRILKAPCSSSCILSVTSALGRSHIWVPRKWTRSHAAKFSWLGTYT